MLTPSSTNPEVTRKGDYIFRSCFIDPGAGRGHRTIRRAHTQRQSGPGSWSIARTIIRPDSKNSSARLSPNWAAKMVVTQSYAAGDQDFNAQITSIKGANPDVIFVPGYYGDVALSPSRRGDKGITVPLVGGDGWDAEQLYKIGGAALNGSFFSNHVFPL